MHWLGIRNYYVSHFVPRHKSFYFSGLVPTTKVFRGFSWLLTSDFWLLTSFCHNYSNPQVAHIINQAIHPLLVSQAIHPLSSVNFFGNNPGNIISLSYLLEPKVRLLLVVEPNLPKIPDQFSDVFLFAESSKTLRSRLEKENYKIKPIFEKLWRLKRWALSKSAGKIITM